MTHATNFILYPVIMLLFCFSAYAQPEWVALGSQQPKSLVPQFTAKPDRIEICLRLPGFYKMWLAEQQKYAVWLPGAAAPNARFRLPILSYVVTLPGELAAYELYLISQVEFAHLPVAEPMASSYELDSSQPTNDCIRPLVNRVHGRAGQPVFPLMVKNLGKIHGQNIFLVSLQSFYAESSGDQLFVADNVNIRLMLTNLPLESSKPYPAFCRQLVNWRADAEVTEEEAPPEYLIVTPSAFSEALQPLVAWRTAEGMLVTIKTVEQIRDEMQIPLLSADKLHAYLGLYYHRQPNLTYVLLVGDVEFIPVKYKNDEATDFHYTLLDGSGDWWPDVYLGRLPVDDAAQVTAIVEKTIAYEKATPSRRVLLASYFQDVGLDGIEDRDYIYTSEQFRAYLVAKQYTCERAYNKTTGSQPQYYNNYTPVAPDIQFTGTTQDIVDFVNIGAAIVNHRDHGDPQGWGHPAFRIPDLDKLSNNRYPLMFHVDCATARFDAETVVARRETEGTPVTSGDESFGEHLLRLSARGAVALIAPTRDTTNPINNIFNRGLLGAVWPEMFGFCDAPASRLGQILYRARIQVVREFCPDGIITEKVLSNFRCYHILGDPALRIRQPQ
jgi:hypothetical protein